MGLAVHVTLTMVEYSGHSLPCVVEGVKSGDGCGLKLQSAVHGVIASEGYDFEEALQGLRLLLEDRGLLLLCNRFRRNALVTSMSRQMSDGLGCYLVEPKQGLDPSAITESLGPAERKEVVTAGEAEAYLSEWKSWFEKPVMARWLDRLRK